MSRKMGSVTETESLSIVLPVFNEEPVIREVIEELNKEIAARFRSVDIVVVDDCSTDSTYQVLTQLQEETPHLRLEHFAANQGHGPALLRAIAISSGEWIFHIDSDRQFVAADFWKLWDLREHADLVLGVRAQRQDPRHRLLLSRAVAGMVRVLASAPVCDANVPFRIFRRSLWNELSPLIGDTALAPSIMVTVGATVRGFRVVETNVAHLPRKHSPSSLRLWKLLRFSASGLGELLLFRWKLMRASRDASGL